MTSKSSTLSRPYAIGSNDFNLYRDFLQLISVVMSFHLSFLANAVGLVLLVSRAGLRRWLASHICRQDSPAAKFFGFSLLFYATPPVFFSAVSDVGIILRPRSDYLPHFFDLEEIVALTQKRKLRT